MNFPEGLAFDDVLLVPQRSSIKSRSDVSLKTHLTKRITLNMPLISSNMDTVTEDKMAIEMARNGGIGIIHRYCSIKDQTEMVRRVKRAEAYIIAKPYTTTKTSTIGELRNQIKNLNVHSFLVINEENKLLGLITNRDIKFREDNELVGECMTPRSLLHTGHPGIDVEAAKNIMKINRIQKLPIVNEDSVVTGLICFKDIERIENRPMATLDKDGQLRCGAAIGVKDDYLDRAAALIDAGVDVLVIDIAHGHSDSCINTIKELKKQYPDLDVIAGNIATYCGAKDLILAGADAIKCNIGAGSICTTRLVSGSGVPQLTALLDAAPVCKEYGVPLISDGGNRNSGNICKALAAGASTIMLGRMIAGTDESPGNIMIRNEKRVKIIRGMASYAANLSNAKKQGLLEPDSINSHMEGVDGYVPYTGPVKDTLNQICNGVRSGMSYTGAINIPELQSKRKFIRITNNGVIESGVHDILQS
jgi:IMP dehydrogenase